MNQSEFNPLHLEDWLGLLVRQLPRPLALGLVLTVLIGGALWWVWREREHLRPLLNALRLPKRLPRAHTGVFTIALSHLENDTNCEGEDVFYSALKELGGIEVAKFDRSISTTNADSGRDRAQKFLKRSRADLMIWGEVISFRQRSAVKLFFTPSRRLEGAKETARYQPDRVLDLPDLRADVTTFLGLLVLNYAADFYEQQGRFIADELDPFIARARALLRGDAALGRDPNLHLALADALTTLGKQKGNNESLTEAIAACRGVLGESERDKVPLRWAITQDKIGLALLSLGERESGTTRLEEAVDAHCQALEALDEHTRRKGPLPVVWAMMRNNQGNALRVLGERESGTTHLEEAVKAHREVLKALTQYTGEKLPLQSAAAANNDLGNALMALGRRESDTKRIEAAVLAFREALKGLERKKVPLHWAMTQNNLGNALQSLGEHEAGTASLDAAVVVYGEALREHAREKVPLSWAMTQNNLSGALRLLGERESGTVRLRQAVMASRGALEEQMPEKVPLDWAMTQENLGSALQILGNRLGDPGLVREALECHARAYKVYADRIPFYASSALQDSRRDLEALKRLDPVAYQQCLATYEKMLKRPQPEN